MKGCRRLQAKSKKRDPKKDTPEMRDTYNRMRTMSFAQWRQEMNIIHSRSYMLCFKQFQQAASATLAPRHINALFEYVKTVREVWDGMETTTKKTHTRLTETEHEEWEGQ
jgi:hypothetical protein